MNQSNFRWENGLQFLDRLQERHNLKNLEPDLFGPDDFHPGCIVEVSGKSGVGKSELLLNLVAKCILPVNCCCSSNGGQDQISLHGMNCRVVYVDNDYHFSMSRLATIIHTKISAALKFPKDDEFVSRTCEAALARLTIMRSKSGEGLLTVLYVLDEVTVEEEPFSVLIIDSISAFYWEDRMMLGAFKLGERHRATCDVLRSLARTHRVTILCTNQDLFHRKESSFVNCAAIRVPASDESWYSFSALGNDFHALWDWRIRLTRDPLASSDCNLISVMIKRLGTVRTTKFQITESGVRFYTLTKP